MEGDRLWRRIHRGEITAEEVGGSPIGGIPVGTVIPIIDSSFSKTGYILREQSTTRTA